MSTKIKNRLTPSMENYLETILELERGHGHAHVKDIAERIKIKMPSVTQALSKLKRSKMVNYDRYGAVTLTRRGRGLARRFAGYHRVIFRYLSEKLGVDRATAEEDACRIEHVISRRTLNRIKQNLG